MKQFKKDAIEQLLQERQTALPQDAYQYIKRTVEKGPDVVTPYVLLGLCRDLKCLPTDIMQAV